MKSFMEKNWAYTVPLLYCIVVITYVLIFKEGIYIWIHDFLDGGIPIYKMLRDNGLWFSSDGRLPWLHSEDSSLIYSAFKFQSVFHILFPTFIAFIATELTGTAIAVTSGCLFGKVCLEENFFRYKDFIILISFIYGILPYAPAETIAFASLPALLALLIYLYKTNNFKLLPLAFIYPFFSTFSFFGLFICGYILLFFIIDAIVHKKPKCIMLAALGCVIAGYVITEYKLFYKMLFPKELSLRAVSYVMPSYSLKELLKECFDVFRSNHYHAGSLQQYIVLPVCIIYFICSNFSYIKNGEKENILYDKFNWLIAWFLFNIILYGFNYFKPFLQLIQFILPPLKGFSFARGVWFNPLIIYTAFCVALCNFHKITMLPAKRIIFCVMAFYFISAKSKNLDIFALLLMLYIIILNIKYFKVDAKTTVPYLIALFSILIVPFNGAVYNNIHWNLKNQWFRLNGKLEETALTYGEFYSEKLFEQIKNAIGYDGEWSIAYGMHPGILEYNGIATLDGYHSYYSENYKQKFRKIIAPDLEIDEDNRRYFDDWGGRAYIFSADIDYEPLRKMNLDSAPMYIDPIAFTELEGKYVFSRVEVSNYKELGFECLGSFTDQTSPYIIWVYKN